MISDFIPYGRQNIDEDDIEAVVKVLQSPLITQGPEIDQFEALVAAYCGVRFAVAFNSGTSALHAAMFAAGVQAGDEVVTSPITFVASANAALYMQAHPVLVDIDPASYCLNGAKLARAITARTRVIVPVDYAGYPADLDEIMPLAKQHGLVVIEDAAHALGAVRAGRKVGQQADMTMFSFHPVKHITTGEGGMIVTNRADYDRRLRQFRNHGLVREEARMEEYHGPWYYEMQTLGYNYRMTSIQAALGITQMGKLEAFIAERRKLARVYDQAFEDHDTVRVPPEPPEDSRHAYHLYPLLLKRGINRRAFFNYLRSKNIGAQVHYIPVHFQPYYRHLYGYQPGDFPVAEDFYAREISLPMFPGLSSADQEYVIKMVKGYKSF